ncbi:unnamed protein product [Parnassius apollo]|uniref:(apollo) hypothetical protein n=1 Tax=Parnassius apollo TaxID=110799 RepID=A0A8S3W3R0_PARAO|nr:unnamed protein product [Parnassius apollo]
MSIDGSLIDKESPPPYITFRKGVSSQEIGFCHEFKSFQENMLSMLETWFTKQDDKFTKLLNEFASMKTSIKYISDKYDDLEKCTHEVKSRVEIIEKSVQTNEPRIAYLEAKLDYIEQRARNCNAEISNLPDKRGENLMSIIENIANVIKQPVSARDIVSIHRVPQSNPNSSRPKNVIVKFASQITRDNFISAVRLNKGVTSDQINIQGSPQKVYVNEHLTLQSKKLFRQVRDIAKQNRYRFVWIKHGVILARADVPTPAIAIRSEKDISKLIPYIAKQ